MNMKKIILLCASLALMVSSFGQVKFGLKAGMNVNNIAQNFKESEWEFETKMRMAYHVGAIADIGFNDALSVQTGLLLTSKGYSADLDEMAKEFEEDYGVEVSIDGYDRVIVNYLEIPINLAYNISGFQIYAGPYLAFGIGGKNKWDYTVEAGGMEESNSDEIKYKPIFGEVGEDDLGDDEEAYSAFDYGLNFGVGYQVGPVLVNAGYSLGLGNMNPGYEGSDEDPADYKISNRVIAVSVSFFFGQ